MRLRLFREIAGREAIQSHSNLSWHCEKLYFNDTNGLHTACVKKPLINILKSSCFLISLHPVSKISALILSRNSKIEFICGVGGFYSASTMDNCLAI